MRALVLGAPQPLHLNRWKDDLVEAGTALGWDVTHWPARDAPVDEVVRACKDGVDVLIWARTHGHDPAGDAGAMLRRVEDLGTTTVAVHLDLYWPIPSRAAQIGVHPWWSCQHVYTADGGHQTEFAQRGVNHHWMPPPLGLRWLGRAVPDRARFPHRVVFVGGNVAGIHGPHRARLIGWANRRYGARGFGRYGRHRPVWGADLNTLYASANVAVGDSASAPRYWSDRVPCTLGRGGLLAHPRTEGMAEHGLTDEVMLLFDRFGFDELGARIDALTDRRRRELTDNAITLIGERHLWTHRLEQIAETIGCA